MNHEDRLNIISRAWGRKLDDTYYCFFPWIDRDEQAEAGVRRAGFHEGPAFEWPTDRSKILEHMQNHEHHDLYWCPSLFEYTERKTEYASDERALWADLDEVDPRSIDDYPPTVAWETSPGRYQALWLLNQGDIRGASWEGGENQRLTYALGADESGWDTTQLLRIPEWKNHKLDYRKKGKIPQGKLLWKNGRRYQADDFEDLPSIETTGGMVTDAVLSEVDRINATEVRARIRLKLTRRIRDFLSAREASGDRSDVLWEIETSLAAAGCTVAEIIAVVRTTVWNKYEGRADEMKRLLIEATKATSKISKQDKDEEADRQAQKEEMDDIVPRRLDTLLENIKPPTWLVKGILTEGAVGFIAGEPKSFKSWVGLDLAISVATGARFLNHFEVSKPGPVLYLQEEDPPMTVKTRKAKIQRDKRLPQMSLVAGENGERPEVEWAAPSPVEGDAPIAAVLQGGLILSEELWQEWLDEVLARGYIYDDTADEVSRPFQLIVIDTLMMVAGDVEENRAQEMTTKIFKPMKEIARKHGVALIFVHHMRKGGADGKRGGQRMLGSVANHAWSEDSLYLSLTATRRIEMECESKSYESRSYVISGVGHGKGWQPAVDDRQTKDVESGGQREVTAKSPLKDRNTTLINTLRVLGGTSTVKAISEASGISTNSTRRGMTYLQAKGKVAKEGRFNWYLVK